MARFHTVFNADTQTQTDIPFTAEEEAERDEQEAQAIAEINAEIEKQDKKQVLEDKLSDDSITFEEMKELMRLRKRG